MAPRILKWLIPYLLISATVYAVAKDGLNYGSPFIFMAMRYLLTAALYLVIARRLLLNRSVVLLGFALSLSTVFWILGLEYVSSGESAVLSYTMPFFAIVGSATVLHERASTNQVAGTVIGFAGTTIFALSLIQGFLLLGSLLTIAGAVAWATYTIYLRKLREEEKFSLLGTAFLIGSAPFIIGSIFDHTVNITPEFLGDVLYLSTLGSVVVIYLLSVMVSQERVSAITSMIFAVPAMSLAIQVALSSTIPSAEQLAGCAIMFLGMYIAGRTNAPKNEEVSGF